MRMIVYALLFLVLTQLSASSEDVTKPQQAVLRSAFQWQDCESGHVHHPISTDEVADLIEVLHRDMMSTGRHYLVRASHNLFFSHNNLTGCADVGAAPTMVIQLDLSRMNQVLRLDIDDGVVTVQAGITFEDLEEFLLGRGLSLQGPGIVTPPFAGMSLAAAIESAAHGSSLVGPASIAAGLKSAVLVDGSGHVLALDTPGDLLEGSLGLFGVITEMTLTVTTARKLTVMQMQQEDAFMLEELKQIIDESNAHSLDVTWSPAASIYTTRIWREGNAGMEGDTVNGQMYAPQAWLDEVEDLLDADQADAHDTSKIMCQLIGDMTGFHALVPYRKVHSPVRDPTQVDIGREAPVMPPSDTEMLVGWANRLGSARCLSDSGRDCIRRHAKVTPHTVSITSEDFAAWVEDVKYIISFSAACPNFLFHFRFVMESEAPLAMSSGKQVVSIDIQSYESLAHHLRLKPTPTKHQDLLDEILQLTLCKYRGRPHWALSTNRMILSARLCGGKDTVRAKYGSERFERFMDRRSRYDPQDLFLNPAFVKIASQAEPDRYPGCASREDCFCLNDAHCGQGFECAPASAFPEYNVCRPSLGKDEL